MAAPTLETCHYGLRCLHSCSEFGLGKPRARTCLDEATGQFELWSKPVERLPIVGIRAPFLMQVVDLGHLFTILARRNASSISLRGVSTLQPIHNLLA